MDFRLSPFNLSGKDYWHGSYVSLDGTKTGDISEDDIAEVLYHGNTGDDWDGEEAAVFRLKDGRLVAYDDWWGPTGDGFMEDAYGGDADLYFASNLDLLVRMALGDSGRRLCGIGESE